MGEGKALGRPSGGVGLATEGKSCATSDLRAYVVNTVALTPRLTPGVDMTVMLVAIY
jgi:hypothetical protein